MVFLLLDILLNGLLLEIHGDSLGENQVMLDWLEDLMMSILSVFVRLLHSHPFDQKLKYVKNNNNHKYLT